MVAGGRVPGQLQRHVAYGAIGPTTLRNMFDNTGHRPTICDYLSDVDLDGLEPDNLASRLDTWTKALEAKVGAWGACRKAVNLFMRDATYNHWLRRDHRLDVIEAQLEVPLDSHVMQGLRRFDSALPKPPAVKELDETLSAEFQQAASKMAEKAGIARVHLDIDLWLHFVRDKNAKKQRPEGSAKSCLINAPPTPPLAAVRPGSSASSPAIC
jgi:hypothetical protein